VKGEFMVSHNNWKGEYQYVTIIMLVAKSNQISDKIVTQICCVV